MSTQTLRFILILTLGANLALFSTGCEQADDDDAADDDAADDDAADDDAADDDDTAADDDTADDDDTTEIDQLTIDRANFYPEGISRAADGTFYVGSAGTGEIVHFPAGVSEAETLVEGAAFGGLGILGVLVDEGADVLWACAIDVTYVAPSVLYEINRQTGAVIGSYPLPAPSLCNDLAMDGEGNVYATDTIGGRVMRLPDGDAALETWVDSSSFPAVEEMVMLNGIDHNGPEDAIYVGRADTGVLSRIAIQNDGSAGDVEDLTVSPALQSIDGMRFSDAQTLYAVNLNSCLNKVELDGSNTTSLIQDNLDMGTTFALDDQGHAWVVESQFDAYMDPETEPELPFVVRRVSLD